ncbi:MAG: transposase [Capsulimonadales bacterium]|nr:transposase [Capsulimonadales bacterium]
MNASKPAVCRLTLRLKLHTDDATKAALLDTLRQSTACVNAVCRYGWDNRERNGTRLHHATYKTLRADYPSLPSQLVVSARRKATEALKSTEERRKQGKAVSCPQSTLCPIRYDARSYWVKLSEGVASLATSAGRVGVSFRLCQHYQRYAECLTASADLCYDRKTDCFFLHVVIEVETPELVADGVLGVDLGIVELATDSHGNAYSGEAVKSVRRKYRRIRSLLQSKGTRSAKRHLKRIRQKVSRFTRDTNYKISKALVHTASLERKALALEDLTGIRDRAETVSRQMRWLLGGWSFYQLRQFLSYKAQAAGVPVFLVDPRNTSRTCSACGYCDKANRKSQASFECLQCGFCENADRNAARNIEARASLSERLLCQPCPA